MSEYIDIKTSFGVIRQEFDKNNNQTGLLSLKIRLNSMAKSIRYLTIPQLDHKVLNDATNMTVYLEIENMNTKLIKLLGNTNKTFMKALQGMHSEIMTITGNESTDVQRLESQISAQKIAMSSEIVTLQSELHKLKDTLLDTFFQQVS